MIKPKPKQTCTTCPHQSKCWAVVTNSNKPVSTQNVLINIMICRLQLGIDRDKVTKNLLQILRPGMIRLISYVKQTNGACGMDIDQLLCDMQSTTIEYLLYDYKIGDRGRATPYLFDPHQGFLTKWIRWIVGKNRRFHSHHELYSPLDSQTNMDQEDDSYHPSQWTSQTDNQSGWDSIMSGSSLLHYDPYAAESDFGSYASQKLMDIIEDGVTLNSNEYRVITFCMANANEANSTRHIDGLHIYLAKLMGVSRPRITRLYKRARDKITNKYAEIRNSDD